MSDGPLENAPRQKTRRQLERDRRRQDDDDMGAVMLTPAGRRFVWRLLDRGCGVFAPSMTSDDRTTAHNEGRRSVGLALMAELQRETFRGRYLDMVRESLDQVAAQLPDEEPSDDDEKSDT